MYTFVTAEPITLEIRNTAGRVAVDLLETTTTTVEVTADAGHPLGFLDDVFRALSNSRRWGGTGATEPAGIPFAADSAADEPDPAAAVLVEYRESDSGATVVVDTDPARDGWRSSFALHITAPIGSSIRVQGTSADVAVTGSCDKVEVRTASGDITLAEVFGKAMVHTASGDISIARAGSDIDLRTASGDIKVGPVAGNALVHTTSGNVRLGATGGDISARSVSGDVRLADAMSGRTEVSAVTGDVEIGVHSGSRASVNLSTLTGNTVTDFEVSSQAPDGDTPSLDITVKTTSGDIRLRRAA